MKVLITGASGFFGSILQRRFRSLGFETFGVDILPNAKQNLELVDIRNIDQLNSIFRRFKPEIIVHTAALLGHGHVSRTALYETNVMGTANLLETSSKFGIEHFIFTSTNCLWGQNFDCLVNESFTPKPIDFYGHSKLAAENLVLSCPNFKKTIFRSPTIMSAGRVGLLSILFDFIRESRNVYLVGNGENRYQFINAEDYVKAIVLAISSQQSVSEIFHIGNRIVPTLEDLYSSLIVHAKSQSKIVHLPKSFTEFSLRISSKFHLIPLGAYHAKMLSSNFIFDTSRIEQVLNWISERNNTEDIIDAWNGWISKNNTSSENSLSPHQRDSRMGLLRLLKFLS